MRLPCCIPSLGQDDSDVGMEWTARVNKSNGEGRGSEKYSVIIVI